VWVKAIVAAGTALAAAPVQIFAGPPPISLLVLDLRAGHRQESFRLLGPMGPRVPRASCINPGVVLTGQDGFSPDQARGFAATPQPFLFGVCAPEGTSPICSVDPATAPKAMDLITPPEVSQATELDPTLGPVVIQGVAIP
jgi:hypothetical protein